MTQQYLFHLGVVEPVEVKSTLHIETLTAGTFVRFFIVVNKHMDRFYLFVFEIAVTIYANVFLLVGSIVRACAQYLKQHVHTLDNFVKDAKYFLKNHYKAYVVVKMITQEIKINDFEKLILKLGALPQLVLRPRLHHQSTLSLTTPTVILSPFQPLYSF